MKPFWAIEYEYLEARDNLERDCAEAENLLEAVECGANMTWLIRDGKQIPVGYLAEDYEFIRDYNFKEKELKHIKVMFEALDRDEDGYTTAVFKEMK